MHRFAGKPGMCIKQKPKKTRRGKMVKRKYGILGFWMLAIQVIAGIIFVSVSVEAEDYTLPIPAPTDLPQ